MKFPFFNNNVFDSFTKLIKKNSNIDEIVVKKYKYKFDSLNGSVLFDKEEDTLKYYLEIYMNKLKLKEFFIFELTHNGYVLPHKTYLMAIESRKNTLVFPIVFNLKFLDFFLLPINNGFRRKDEIDIYQHHYVYSPFNKDYGDFIFYEVYGELNLTDNKITHYEKDQNCFNKDILYLSSKIKVFPRKENILKIALIHNNQTIKEKLIENESFNKNLIFNELSKITFPYFLSDEELEAIGLERPNFDKINDDYEKFYTLYTMLNI